MRRATFLVLAAALSAAPLLASAPAQLFAKAKEQFRLAAYPAALETLGELDTATSTPDREKERAALLPALHFYRGACYAALGRAAEAREQFEVFLTHQPNASLDPALYPRKVIAALEDARKSLDKRGRREEASAPAAPLTSLAQSYAAFRLVMDPETPNAEESWAEGPVRFLLSPEERREFQSLAGAAARSEFVTAFWKARDPKPETEDNEIREEFEKRVAFADSRFTQEETRGSMTDRGMVFILLGPPTYVGRKPLTTGEDANDAAGLKRYRPSDVRAAVNQPASTGTTRAARVDAVTGPGTRINEAAANWREVWHYRRENLPKDVPYLQVDFDFVTKAGYGRNVLQREAQVLDTLERAKAKLRDAKA